jgi:endonuclease/exonuclease/phosphatase family metal-dependent hydrolase
MSQDQTPLHLNGTLQKARIDWVLVRPHLSVTDARIIMDRFEDRYPSYHFPYMVDLSTNLSP